MTDWIDLVIVTVIGGVFRYELEAFLKRKHNNEIEEVQKTLAIIAARQLARQEDIVVLLESIQKSLAKG